MSLNICRVRTAELLTLFHQDGEKDPNQQKSHPNKFVKICNSGIQASLKALYLEILSLACLNVLTVASQEI